MELKQLAGLICDEADDFLGATTKAAEARAGIAEWLTIHHPALPFADKRAVVDLAMQILQREGFFERSSGEPDGEAGTLGEASD